MRRRNASPSGSVSVPENGAVGGSAGQRNSAEVCRKFVRRRCLLYILFVAAFVLAASTLWRFSEPADFYFKAWIEGGGKVDGVATQVLPDASTAPDSLAVEAAGPSETTPSSTPWRPFLTHHSAGGQASHWCVSEVQHPVKEMPGGIVTGKDVQDAQKHCSLDLRRVPVPIPPPADNLQADLVSAPFYNERLLWGVKDAAQCLKLCLDQHPTQCAGVVFRSFHGHVSNSANKNLQLDQQRQRQRESQKTSPEASTGLPRLCVHKIDDERDPLPLRIDATGRVPAHVQHTWCIRPCA